MADNLYQIKLDEMSNEELIAELRIVRDMMSSIRTWSPYYTIAVDMVEQVKETCEKRTITVP